MFYEDIGVFYLENIYKMSINVEIHVFPKRILVLYRFCQQKIRKARAFSTTISFSNYSKMCTKLTHVFDMFTEGQTKF